MNNNITTVVATCAIITTVMIFTVNAACESGKTRKLLPKNSNSGNEKVDNTQCGGACAVNNICTIYQFTSPSPSAAICYTQAIGYNDKCDPKTQNGTVNTITGTCQSGSPECTCNADSNPVTTVVDYPVAVTCQ
jgi:hypothetical protein